MKWSRRSGTWSSIVIALLLVMQPGKARGADTIQWQQRGIGGGGNIFATAISPHDPNVMIGISDVGGLYWSGDGGQSWVNANNAAVAPAHWASYGTDFRIGCGFNPDPDYPDVAYCGGRRSEDK